MPLIEQRQPSAELPAPAASASTELAAPGAPSSPSPSSPAHPRQKVLILCGLVGSGKSTFAEALHKADPKFVRACQDILGSRGAVESCVSRSLEQGKNVIIDRTNIDPAQRATWLQVALQHQTKRHNTAEVQVDTIFFDTPFEECRARLQRRLDHETLHDPQQAVRVLHTFAAGFVAPTLQEGFHKVLVVKPHEVPRDLTANDVAKVMQRLESTSSALERGTLGPTQPCSRPSPRPFRGANRGWGALQRRGRGFGGPPPPRGFNSAGGGRGRGPAARGRGDDVYRGAQGSTVGGGQPSSYYPHQPSESRAHPPPSSTSSTLWRGPHSTADAPVAHHGFEVPANVDNRQHHYQQRHSHHSSHQHEHHRY